MRPYRNSLRRKKLELLWRTDKFPFFLILGTCALLLPLFRLVFLHNTVIVGLVSEEAKVSLSQTAKIAEEIPTKRITMNTATAAIISDSDATISTSVSTATESSQKAEVNAVSSSKHSELSPLPSAKSLLNMPQPYRDSDILRLSDELITSPNTVVTEYFRVASKYVPGKYDEWMENMLSLQDPMVIFTQPELVDQIKNLRSHALNRTVIIQMKLEDLPIGTLFPKKFWERQLQLDPERRIHKSYQLFWIWLSKSWCTMEAIRHNFFQSDLFMYSDIGCFRNKKYFSKTMIQHREQVPPHEMVQMAHHTPNPPEEELFNDKYKRKPNFYHSGSQFAGYKDTWIKFHEYFLDTIDRFLEKDMLIVEDQAVLQSTCLSHPEICAYFPFNQVGDNHYFGLRYPLHYGGNYNLWRHNAAIEAKKQQ